MQRAVIYSAFKLLPALTFLKRMSDDKSLPISEAAYRLALQLNKAVVKFPACTKTNPPQ
jgi:hypothetical protein